MACINDDWEHQVGVVNPLLQDMNCGEEYFTTTQDVSSVFFAHNLKFKLSLNEIYHVLPPQKCVTRNIEEKFKISNFLRLSIALWFFICQIFAQVVNWPSKKIICLI